MRSLWLYTLHESLLPSAAQRYLQSWRTRLLPIRSPGLHRANAKLSTHCTNVPNTVPAASAHTPEPADARLSTSGVFVTTATILIIDTLSRRSLFLSSLSGTTRTALTDAPNPTPRRTGDSPALVQ